MAAPIHGMGICSVCRRLLNHGITVSWRNIRARAASNLVVNHKVSLDKDVQQAIENKVYIAKKHPGVLKVGQTTIPDAVQEAVSIIVEKFPIENLISQSQKLSRYLTSRHLPVEEDTLINRAHQERQQILEQQYPSFESMPVDEQDVINAKIKDRVLHNIKWKTYNWKRIDYDAQKSLLYLMGRFAAEYSSLKQVLFEIMKRDKHFQPKTVFDFGSGVGSSIWAMRAIWSKNEIIEQMCIDVSSDMNTIARLMLQQGEPEEEMCFPEIYFRQFFPPSAKHTYDIVISAYTLTELPSQQDRLRDLLSLWRKTKKYMIIVENGTNAGFKVVSEARDFILQLGREPGTAGMKKYREENMGHVFAPCPHDLACPRVDRNDGTPCNFEVKYNNLTEQKINTVQSHTYSYVILCKGEKPEEDPQWPRIVRRMSTPSRRVNIQTCTSKGQLEVATVTIKRHSTDCYRCLRACSWGDLAPIHPIEEDIAQEITVTPT